MEIYGMKSTFIVYWTLLVVILLLPDGINSTPNRNRYAGRVMKISPVDCKSDKYPGLVGNCMLSLECGQRGGQVIGACRDGLLFGACCHNAAKPLEVHENRISPSSHEVEDTTVVSLNAEELNTETNLKVNSIDPAETILQALSKLANIQESSGAHPMEHEVVENEISLKHDEQHTSKIEALTSPITPSTTPTSKSSTTTTTEKQQLEQNEELPSSKPSTTSAPLKLQPNEVSETSKHEVDGKLDSSRKQEPIPKTDSKPLVSENSEPIKIRDSEKQSPKPQPPKHTEPSKTKPSVNPKPDPIQNPNPSQLQQSEPLVSDSKIVTLNQDSSNYKSQSPANPISSKPEDQGKPSTSTPMSIKGNFSTQEISSETTTTVPITTKKFFYGKIKYTRRHFTPRPTTQTRPVWTRPPTTAMPFKILSTTEGDDEDSSSFEDDYESHLLFKPPSSASTSEMDKGTSNVSQEVTTASPSSLETMTKGVTNSVETMTKVTADEDVTLLPTYLAPTTEASNKLTVDEAENYKNTEELNSNSENLKSSPKIDKDQNGELSEKSQGNLTKKANSPGEKLKQSRISDTEPDSNSAAWDNKLDEFVNQVVEGIAEELDKSNIEDVVFDSDKSSSTTTTTSTTTTVRPLPTKRRTRPKSGNSGTKKRHKYRQKVKSKAKYKQREKQKIKHRQRYENRNKAQEKVSLVNKEQDSNSSEETENVEINSHFLDYRTACGVRPLAIRKGRIVGGTPSRHGSWPWHALIKESVWWGIFSKIKCGGVLVSAKHVVTAAHCKPQYKGTLSVVVGVTDSDKGTIDAVTKGVRAFIPHPGFNPRTYENDIAVLELDSPVEFQPHIVPICLPGQKERFAGKKGFVTGMGLLRHDGERPLVLHEVDVPIVNNSECKLMFRKSGSKKPIRPSFICAGYKQGRKDSCGGDSGGPLSVQRDNGQWVLAGTVSHGIKCAIPNQPGIYMRTTWYLPWIQKVMESRRGGCIGPRPVCDTDIHRLHREHRPRRSGILSTLFRMFTLWWRRK